MCVGGGIGIVEWNGEMYLGIVGFFEVVDSFCYYVRGGGSIRVFVGFVLEGKIIV